MRIRIATGPEGEVVLPAGEADALGLTGGGEGEIISASGAFALLLPARGDEPAAWFAGSLAAMTVPEAVQFIFTSLKTGVLLLAFGEGRGSAGDDPERLRRKSIYFRDGQIGWARCCGGRGWWRRRTWSGAAGWGGPGGRWGRCGWTRGCSRPGSSTR